jgi:hypothetical protein
MDDSTEHGCEYCGGQILKPTPKVLSPRVQHPAGTNCDACGHVTPLPRVRGFQCSQRLLAFLHHLCSEEELKQLRLSPTQSLGALNKKLAAAGKPALEVDTSTYPPTLMETANRGLSASW